MQSPSSEPTQLLPQKFTQKKTNKYDKPEIWSSSGRKQQFTNLNSDTMEADLCGMITLYVV